MSSYKSPHNELDPLDNEILERAFDATWDSIKSSGQHFDTESDEELEAALRRELVDRRFDPREFDNRTSAATKRSVHCGCQFGA